jgi:hypothetical protein
VTASFPDDRILRGELSGQLHRVIFAPKDQTQSSLCAGRVVTAGQYSVVGSRLATVVGVLCVCGLRSKVEAGGVRDSCR